MAGYNKIDEMYTFADTRSAIDVGEELVVKNGQAACVYELDRIANRFYVTQSGRPDRSKLVAVCQTAISDKVQTTVK